MDIFLTAKGLVHAGQRVVEMRIGTCGKDVAALVIDQRAVSLTLPPHSLDRLFGDRLA